MAARPLIDHLPERSDDDALLAAILDWSADHDLTLYDAQEEAILEVLAGNNVILSTPTGSGKSLVALAAHFAAVARGQRSYYTAPIKALVSEKFFDLCRELGTDNVGMVTGDAAVNTDAPVITCTAEIVANVALRDGSGAAADHICMDEFHYYADPQRGSAWQIPLLELTGCAFLLMSATLGDMSTFKADLTRRTGRPTALVTSAERPVPLDFEYRRTTLHDTIDDLLAADLAPIYVVHFTQRAATEHAQSLTSLKILDKDAKKALAGEIGGFRFGSPFGRDLSRIIRHGIGVHHAGLLPRYRLLVEKLAQSGRLKVICGTDTLGVGVNVPIRTVLFTQLCKYDGVETRLLRVREFQQIAGRAGRRGYDDRGYVVGQAPEHVVENLKMEEKTAGDAKKRRKLVKRKAPERGYRHWDDKTFAKLVGGEPETLVSSFGVTHSMVLEVLDRPGDGCGALRTLLTDNHEPRKLQRRHIRRAIQIYRSLLDAQVIERLPVPDDLGRLVRVNLDLQQDFRLNQPLSPFVLELAGELDRTDPEYALNILTIVESVLENPRVILQRQLDKVKDELIGRLKSEGVEYEQRMEELDKAEYPKPMRDFVYEHFNAFARRHPWVGGDNIAPKSVARDLFERSLTFREYVNHYGLKRSEGLLLRYLSDVYKGMEQTVPIEAKTDEVLEIIDWLGTVVRQVDSSLLEEWERLRDPDHVAGLAAAADTGEPTVDDRPDITRDGRGFRLLVRNEVFRWVMLLSRRRVTDLAGALDTVAADATEDHPGHGGWSGDDLAGAMEEYWEEYDHLDSSPAARGPQHFAVTQGDGGWVVNQTLLDPEDNGDWKLRATVDLAASRALGRLVMGLEAIGRQDRD